MGGERSDERLAFGLSGGTSEVNGMMRTRHENEVALKQSESFSTYDPSLVLNKRHRRMLKIEDKRLLYYLSADQKYL